VNRSCDPAFVPLVVFTNVDKDKGGIFFSKRCEGGRADLFDMSPGIFHEGLKIGNPTSRADGRRTGLPVQGGAQPQTAGGEEECGVNSGHEIVLSGY
jgi:hypothetical protein